MRNKCILMLWIIIAVLCFNAGCSLPAVEESFDWPTTTDGLMPGGENPDKDGMDNVQLYALSCDRLQNRRSYDDKVTAKVAEGMEKVIKDIPFASVDYEAYWDFRLGDKPQYEVLSLNLEYVGWIYTFILYNDGRMYRDISYEGADMVKRVTRYDLDEKQMEAVIAYLEEVSADMTLMSESD